ncbi:carboxypeptidase-like regulatory domain-containing protein [Winogradskyella maritima]|nr:carboxypeptidase-like regulatory domain-containing protein [Winogradskyella maritima]
MCGFWLWARAVHFKGTITDANDELPIPGVSVFLEKSSYGGVTDFDGNYEFKVLLSLENIPYWPVT